MKLQKHIKLSKNKVFLNRLLRVGFFIDETMEDKIQSFRQPLVTATGIILGFILNFASTFVKSDSDLSDSIAYIIGICILTGIICLIIVLSRVLKMKYSNESAESYYQKTLNYFLFGISISFVGVMIDMFTNFMSE